jgi:hypothetical protein
MRLGEKIRYLRLVEGTLRGLDREMTQQEVVRAIKPGAASVHQPVLSFANRERRASASHQRHAHAAGASFLSVHPGYLVDDPEGFHTELISDVRGIEDQLDLVAHRRSRAFPPRSGSEPGAA